MRKFKLIYKDFMEVANNQVSHSINTREISCEDFNLDDSYLTFLGETLPNSTLCRLILAIPRENLISIEEIF